MMFLLERVPPGHFYPQTYLLVNLSLARKDSFGTLHCLLDIFSQLIKRFRQRLAVLSDDRQ